MMGGPDCDGSEANVHDAVNEDSANSTVSIHPSDPDERHILLLLYIHAYEDGEINLCP